MALIDYNGIFSDAQAFTAQEAAVSTNVVDCGTSDANLGKNGMRIVVRVNTTFTSAGAATLTVKLEDCATAGGSYTELSQGEAYALAALAKGVELLEVGLPAQHLRYLRCSYTVATADMTAGAVDAYMVEIDNS